MCSAPSAAGASSHREAPAISEDPAVDDTDTYAFVSPEHPDRVVLIGNWFPAEEPSGGPNYFRFSDAARYRINIDRDGELPVDDIVYEFAFTTEVRSPEDPTDPAVGTFLAATGPITALDDATYNLRQYFTVSKIVNGTRGTPIDRDVGGRRLLSPPNNIGPFSTPNYPALATAAVYDIGDGVRVFAGQRDDAFFVDLGAVFDGLQLRPITGTLRQDNPARLGQPGGGKDALAGFNVHTIALEIPIDQLVTTEQPILGMYTSASRPTMLVRSPEGDTHSADFVQVSRLGFPLANELFGSIPTIKDQYNRAEPGGEFDVEVLLPRVRNPELTNLFRVLFPEAFTTMNLPPQDNRLDLVAAVFTGVPGVNKIGDEPAPADLLRLNTSLGSAKRPGDEGFSSLGVLGGDTTGFPNGRRPWDDVVDIELRVAAGVLYKALIDPESPDFNVAPNNLLADGVDVNDLPFLDAFPFLAHPSGGKDTPHAGPVQGTPELPTATPSATITATPNVTPTNTRARGDSDDSCHIGRAHASASSAWVLLIPAALVALRRPRRAGHRDPHPRDVGGA
ncbi:MAG: DUF4331 domain-containing protein [Candidatus Binatia bacterium]